MLEHHQEIETSNQPLTLVIYGGTGDLTHRKLLPALYHLMADERLPLFLAVPVQRRLIICEPMLTAIDLRAHLCPGIAQVAAGGESGDEARLMRYDWALSLREQCAAAGVPFWFRQTGARFEKDGKVYRIKRRDQFSQARKSGLSWPGK